MSTLTSVVLDVGSRTTKCGFSGEEAPRETFLSAVGVPRHQGLTGTMLSHRSDIVAGSEMEEDKGLFHVNHPIQNSKVVDWEALEQLMYYSLYNRLEVQPENTPCLYISPADQSRPEREKIAEMLFESFNVPLVGFLNSASASVYGTGRTTGLSLDSGAGRTTVAAVSDGYALTHSMRTSLLAGDVLTEELFAALKLKGYPLSTQRDWEMVDAAKAACCRVSTDLAHSKAQFEENGPRTEDSFALPDDERLFLFEHQFMIPERLFDPSLITANATEDLRPKTPSGFATTNTKCQMDSAGWLTLIDEVIAASPAVIQDDLYGNVVLSGGTSMLRDLEKRLQKELVQRRGNTPPVRCIAFPERARAAWIGGSIWSCGPNFAHSCTSKTDYDENGPTIVHRVAF